MAALRLRICCTHHLTGTSVVKDLPVSFYGKPCVRCDVIKWAANVQEVWLIEGSLTVPLYRRSGANTIFNVVQSCDFGLHKTRRRHKSSLVNTDIISWVQDLKWIKVKSAAVFHVMQCPRLQCIKGSGLWSYATRGECRWRNWASALFVNSGDAQDGGLALAGNLPGQCKVLLAHCKRVQNHVEQYGMVAGCWWSYPDCWC